MRKGKFACKDTLFTPSHVYLNNVKIRNFPKLLCCSLRYDLTDTAGVLENKVLSMFHGLHDYSVLVSNAIFGSNRT